MTEDLVEQYYPVRDAIHDRLVEADICPTYYSRFIRLRNRIERLIGMLSQNMDFMLNSECISESELIRLLEEPRFHELEKANGVILAWSIKKNRVVFLEWFLKRGGLEKHYPDAIYWAAKLGQTDVLSALIAHGAEVSAWNHAPLRYAAWNGHLQAVKLLLAEGSDVSADNYGAERLAALNEHTEIVNHLSGLRATQPT